MNSYVPINQNLIGVYMLYLGPIDARHTRIKNSTNKPQAVMSSGAFQRELAQWHTPHAPLVVEQEKPALEMDRRQGEERRCEPRDPLLETRVGRDRRGAKNKRISISI
jgi:hypothetical protein